MERTQILTKKKFKELFLFLAHTTTGSNKTDHNSLKWFIVYYKFVFLIPHRKEMQLR